MIFLKNNYVNSDGIPMGFGMLLAQNQQAMERFAGLSRQEKQSVIDGARSIRSKAEMQDYVNKLGQFPFT